MSSTDAGILPRRVALISKAMTLAATHSKARLLGQHCQLTLITPEHWVAYSHEPVEPSAGFEWIRLPTVLTGWNHFHLYRGLTAALARAKPDLIHIDEEPWSAVTWQALRQAARLGVPSLAYTWQNLDNRYPPPFEAIERSTYARVRLMLAGNVEAAELLRKRGFGGPIRVIPQFGVDLSVFAPRPSTRQALGLPPDGLLVGYVGRLVKEKGIDLAVEALPLLPGHRLAVAGTGPEEGPLKALAQRLGVADRVHFLGGFASTRIPEAIASFDVLILPSRRTRRWKEQFGRVLVEAMAMGIPVVGSSSGEIPHVIADAGVVFPEDDRLAFVEALKALSAPGRRAELSARGRQRAASYYSQEIVAEQTLAAWRDAFHARS